MKDNRQTTPAYPVFPTATIQLKVSILKLEDIGQISASQRSAPTALGVPDAGSFVTFDFEGLSLLAEALPDNTLVHIFEGISPGISGEYSRDDDGNSVWRIYVAVAPEPFYYLRRHITGIDHLSGELIRYKPMTDLVEIIGHRFEPMNPDDPSDLSFEGELAAFRVGGWLRE